MSTPTDKTNITYRTGVPVSDLPFHMQDEDMFAHVVKAKLNEQDDFDDSVEGRDVAECAAA